MEIAENFNSFFTSKGKNIQKEIPPTKETFTGYIRRPNSEISDRMNNLKSRKSVGLL